MAEFLFDLQRFAPPEGGGGGGSSSSVSWTGATSITSAGTYSNQTYSSTTDAQCAVLVSLSSGQVNLVNPTVTKSGGPSNAGDNYNFYGINSGIMAMGGGTVSIVGGTVTTTGVGANAVFSYGGNGGTNGAAGDGTTVYIEDVTIQTSASGSGGIMTTGGGTTVAKNLTITTQGQSSAPIRTDRGGGSVTVTGGSYTSNGLGSPAIYSTAAIEVNNATLTSNLSEGVCIEGQNSVILNNCTLTANNTQTNGNAQFLDAVILYQSQSGDAADGTSTFTMNGGTLVNKSGHVFHVTNTEAVINLSNVTINDTGESVLLSVCDDGWSGASNVATLNASGQELTGDILVGSDSTLALNLTNGSTFTGNLSGTITNEAGTDISTSLGTVNVTLDSSSKWYLAEDAYISSFSGTAANVITGDYKLYVNGSVLSGTTESEEESAFNLNNTTNATLITGTAYADSILNSGDNVTINALAENDTLENSGANVSILAGAGDDSVYNSGDNVTINALAENDTLENSGANVSILAGAGDDSISNDGYNVSIDAGDGNDYIQNTCANVTIDAGDGNDYIQNTCANVTIDAGDGNDFIDNMEMAAAISISAGEGADTVVNYGAYVTILGGAGNDSIASRETSDNVTIDGGAGADTIENFASYSSIVGGAGNDSIYSYGESFEVESVTISGGDGADTIESYTPDSSILGGANADTVINYGSNVSIDAGAGNDLISLSGDGSAALVEYTSSEGNDSIVGFGANTSLQIGDGSGTYTKTISGDDLILTVGEGTITLVGAASLETLNILGEESSSSQPEWSLNGTTASYGTDSETYLVLEGVSSTDGLEVSDQNVVTVPLSCWAGGATEVTMTLLTAAHNFTLAKGDGLDAPATVKEAYKAADDGTTVYNTAGKSAGYTLSKNTISYVTATAKYFTLSGAAISATKSNFYVSGKTVTIGKAAVQTNGAEIFLPGCSDGLDYTLKPGKNMTASKTYSANTYTASTMTYNTKGKTAGYILDNDAKSIKYTAATTKTFKFTGIADGATVTMTSSPDNEYTLKLGKGMTSTSTTTAASLDGTTYSISKISKSYAPGTDSLSISYNEDVDTNLEMSGMTAEPRLNKKVVALTANNFSDASIVSNDGSYAFSVVSGSYSGKTFAGSASADSIYSAGAKLILSGGGGNDTILGDANVNVSDKFYGAAGNDSLYGGAGNDSLYGGDDADKIFGGAGNDYISGGNGNDSVSGGGTVILRDVSSSDTFNINGTSYTISNGSGTKNFTRRRGGDFFIDKSFRAQ